MPCLTQNQKERISFLLALFQDAFKVFVACLLSVFVPQYCEDTKTTCTLEQNFENLTPYNIFVVLLNFITLFIFIWLYIIELRREFFFIKKLDIDKDYADNYLITALRPETADSIESLKTKQTIHANISYYNVMYYRLIKISIALLFLNALFSAILIFYYFYDGFRSVSSFIANLMLVTSKLFKNFEILRSSIKSEGLQAISTSVSEPVSYNVIDKKIVRRMSAQPVQVELESVKEPHSA